LWNSILGAGATYLAANARTAEIKRTSVQTSDTSPVQHFKRVLSHAYIVERIEKLVNSHQLKTSRHFGSQETT